MGNALLSTVLQPYICSKGIIMAVVRFSIDGSHKKPGVGCSVWFKLVFPQLYMRISPLKSLQALVDAFWPLARQQ